MFDISRTKIKVFYKTALITTFLKKIKAHEFRICGKFSLALEQKLYFLHGGHLRNTTAVKQFVLGLNAFAHIRAMINFGFRINIVR